ncbi:MAG TPA: lysylphosphatidylglycerol synthase transmembrane domain-containing protein [Candidatus Saccharimonadales bacterium]|nr:lysylphosphatidylglycerol synthase transmembrane domain-containing protein [Candidatus Saccharimonadales bacterium]
MRYIKQHWKMLLNILTIFVLVIIIYAIRKELVSTLDDLSHVNAWALLLLVPIEALNYHAQAKLYQGLFDIVGNKISYSFLYKMSLELNFVNGVFPSGGVSGVSYFGVRMRSNEEGITGSKATVVQLIKLVLIFISFEILLIVGLLFLSVGGHVNDVTILVASSITTLVIVLNGGFLYIIGSRTRINATFSALTRSLNRIIKVFRPKHPETIKLKRVHEIVDELHNNYRLIQDNYKRLGAPLMYALLANLTEVLAVYFVYVAFGHWVNIGAIILAYSVANFAGLISVLPGGIGTYEAIMTAVLAAAGIPINLSIPVVVMYRILNTLIQLPPGYYFYHKALSRPKEA